ncbi:MAG: glycosyltransferase family 2 protein [Myxococcota bacterium]|nr:glycosyltransferase family 2 protein [Myxococcota bacterium]
MTWAEIILVLFASIAFLALLKANYDLRQFRCLDTLSFDESALPFLSIVICGRNEQESIQATITDLTLQSRFEAEIIFVDDRSTDGTPKILEELQKTIRNLKTVRVNELPQGWLGKNHACQVGQEVASGDWILFTDADIRFQPDAIPKALQYAISQELDHLTVLPKIVSQNRLVRLLACAATNILISGTRAASIARLARSPNARDRTRGRVLGIGAFNLVRTETWRESQGFSKICGEVLDDMGVAWLIRKQKGRSDWLWSKAIISVDWYRSVPALYLGMSKSFLAGAKYRPALLIIQAIGLAAISASPWVCLFHRSQPVCVTLGSITAGMLLRVAYRRARMQYQSAVYTVLAPLSQLILATMMLGTALRGLARPHLSWRGTDYSFELLRKAQVVWKK